MNDWGISEGYHDVAGQWRDVPAETLAAIRRAMGAPADAGAGDGPAPPGTAPSDDPVVAFRPGQAPARASAAGPWELHTEDGAVLAVESGADLPPDLPLGYHRLRHAEEGRERLLIVSPGRCHLPPDLRTWGWAAQLYATRSRESWGMGDLADLRRLAEWSRRQGAGMCLLNPLHATVPDFPQPSPYYPSSRCFRNPLYLRIEHVPGAAGAATEGFDLAALAAEGRALNADRRIDRGRVWKLKGTALEHLWSAIPDLRRRPRLRRLLRRAGGGPHRLRHPLRPHRALPRRLDGLAGGVPPARLAGGGPLRRRSQPTGSGTTAGCSG